jgi:hypothetical protein
MTNRARVWLVFIILFIVTAISFINFFIWPFEADNPNFSDVDKAYGNISIPKDWKLISTSENKGTAGRTCPIESSGCFSKRGLYSLPEGTDVAEMTEFLTSAGCKSISTSDSSSKDTKMYTFYCQLTDGVKLGSDFKVDAREAYISIHTY